MRDPQYSTAIDDSGVEGAFVDLPVLNKAKSIEAGENVYDLAMHCVIRGKGSTESVAYRIKPTPEGERLVKRFPEAYAAYQSGEEVEIDGTPLNELPGLGSFTAATWRAQGIRTIEELAAAPEHVLNRLGHGARKFQKAAAMFVENAELKAQQAAAPPKRGPGRPRKNQIAAE